MTSVISSYRANFSCFFKSISVFLTFAFISNSTSLAALPTTKEGKPVYTISPLIKTANPAVVNISTSATVESALMNDPFFRFFYGTPRKQEVSSLGSGVIVDAKKGYIVTNHHVIKDADQITVGLQDGRDFDAELIGSDEDTDLAVIRIKAKNLTALPWSDSDALEVGDFVVAIGNPFGLGHTVTSGIISAKGRQGLGIEEYEDFIQTDAAINPGNSGGALVTLHGELAGINTAIYAPSGGNVGIGFAIPSNIAKNVMQQLIQYGEVRRGLLGISVDSVTPSLARSFKLQQDFGVIVTGVQPGSPADKAGIETYDVITEINGKTIRNNQQLNNHIGLLPLGTSVTIEFWRNNKKRIVTAKVSELPSKSVSGSEIHPLLEGVELVEKRDSRQANIGISVRKLETDSRAAYWGLKRGDLIVGVGRYRVRDFDEFKRVADASGRRLHVTIERNDRRLLLSIR
ncbi:MAG: DegQ family serine endoprotease [Pseudomonadota bacterium]